MNNILRAIFGVVCSSGAAQATVTTFTSPTDFYSATSNPVLVENFEGVSADLTNTLLTGYTSSNGAISFTPISSTPYDPNLVITSPGYTNFGAGLNPTASRILAANGNEDFVGTLNGEVHALGFDVFLNDSPFTLSFFSGTTLLATIMFDTPPTIGNNLAFAGIISTEQISSFHWQAVNGQTFNTGVDNIYTASIPSVPEPVTWTMMLAGMLMTGTALRQKRTHVRRSSKLKAGARSTLA